MLERLLAEIRSGGSFETRLLADRLGTSPALVEAMLEHLGRTGLIRPYPSCDDVCGGCSLKAGCRAGHGAAGVRLWQAREAG